MKCKIFGCCIAFLLILTGSTFAQWNYEYQKELGITFYGVHFPAQTAGYMVGSDGAIFKSTDGGGTWVQQTSPVTLALFDVFFKNATEGWAVGDNGVILVTTDGTNWAEHDSSQVMTTVDFNDVFFIGNSGWIGGDGGTVFLTTDNGVNWTTPTTNPYTDDINEISFVDANVGYAAVDGDGIMYTTDGGDTWVVASLDLGPYPYTRTDIECIMTVNATVGVAAGWGSIIGPQPTIILVTNDAGQTWDNPDDTYPWNWYAYGYGLTMFDDGEVVLTGGASSSAAPNIHSTDLGVTWTSEPAFFGETLRDCAAIPGGDRIVAVGAEGCVALSTDRGQTWNFVYDPGPGFAGWHKIVAVGQGAYLVGAAGHLLALNTNPGAALPEGMHVVAPENWAPSRLYDIVRVPFGPMYVCGSSLYLCKSTDGGRTWTELSHTASAIDDLFGMYWFGPDNGILVGEFGSNGDAIYSTVDGGQTLNLISHAVYGDQLNSVSFARDDQLIGVICGDNTIVLYTTDGGVTWNPGTEDVVSTTADFEEVHMVNATVGWLVGDSGIICKTVDGGQNWTQQTAFTSVLLLDVYFSTPDYGWVSGEDNTVFYTDDGGVNWNDISPTLAATGDEVIAVYPNMYSGQLWIGARDGQVLTRDDQVTGHETPISLPFVLNQNFPNPFNPSTSISFSIDRDGPVTLNVYDVSGRLVATVLDKEMAAGDYTVSFQAEGLASGVYFYRLKTAMHEQVRKMILLR